MNSAYCANTDVSWEDAAMRLFLRFSLLLSSICLLPAAVPAPFKHGESGFETRVVIQPSTTVGYPLTYHEDRRFVCEAEVRDPGGSRPFLYTKRMVVRAGARSTATATANDLGLQLAVSVNQSGTSAMTEITLTRNGAVVSRQQALVSLGRDEGVLQTP
jgi:hypothetical protein